MRVVKLGIDESAYKTQHDKAVKECWVCPCCGASEELVTPRGLTSKGKNKVSQYFSCDVCSAEWESEPFYTREHFRYVGGVYAD